MACISLYQIVMIDRKHNEANMNWIEIIQLKSFTGQDRDSAVAAFKQLSAPLSDAGLREIDLFKNPNLENELSILINWHSDMPPNGKSGLGLQLVSAFSEFGYIDHSGWRHSNRLSPKVIEPNIENKNTWRVSNKEIY